MIKENLYALKKSGRVCYLFGWDSHKVPQPWPAGYARVMIPLTAAERKNSSKLVHTQIVRTDNLVKL